MREGSQFSFSFFPCEMTKNEPRKIDRGSHRGKFSMKTVGDEDEKFFYVCVGAFFGSELFDAQPQIDNGNVFS